MTDVVYLIERGTYRWFTESPGQWLTRKDAVVTRYVRESSDGDLGRTTGGCGTGTATGSSGSGSPVAATVVGALRDVSVDEHRGVKAADEDNFVRITGET